MITPIEIQSKTFKSGGLGYDKKDVDSFLRDVLKSYETIYRENMELNDKVAVLTEGIQYYKTIEKTLQKALVLAERTAEETKSAAMDKAKAIEREATARAQLIVADAKNELEHIHNQTIQLIQQYEKYKVQFKNLAAAQMELIQSEAFDISLARLDTFVTPDKEEATKKMQNTQDRPQKYRTKSNEKGKYSTSQVMDDVAITMEEQEALTSNIFDTLAEKEEAIHFDSSFLDNLETEEAQNEYSRKEYSSNRNKNKTKPIQNQKKELIDDYLDDEEDPIHELEHQEEFSFINLIDEED